MPLFNSVAAIDVGDEIQEINGVPIRGRDPVEVIRMLVGKFPFLHLTIYRPTKANHLWRRTKMDSIANCTEERGIWSQLLLPPIRLSESFHLTVTLFTRLS